MVASLPLVGLLFGPAYATLAWALGGVRLVAWRAWPSVDGRLVALASFFLLFCLAFVPWSVMPARSAVAVGQLFLVFAASLVLISDRSIRAGVAARGFGVMSLALLVGVGVMCVDHGLHFPLQHHLAPRELYPGTKYNRGEDYLTLLLWPLLAFWWLDRRYGRALLVVGAVAVACAIGLSTTARVTVPAGFFVLFAAWAAPVATRRVLAIGTVAMATTLPLLLRILAGDRALLWHHLKQSGLHRLEIWSYMTARVFERPVFGWGLATAKWVPIRTAEQSGFVYVDPHGVYPHQQWLELWLETGLAGVVIGTAFALLVLRRIGQLPPRVAPFGYAGFAAAMAVSFSSFELTTDSWWAALALTALLLRWAGEAALP